MTNKQKEPSLAHSPMPSRPNMPPPSLPSGAKPNKLKPLSRSPITRPVRVRVLNGPFFLLIFLFVLLIGIGFVIAESGITNLPLLSSLYRGPQPVRMVQPIADMKASDVFGIIVSRAQSQVLSGAKPPYHATVSEEELTSALNDALQRTLVSRHLASQDLQIVLTPDMAEISGTVSSNSASYHVLVQGTPSIKDGRLTLDIARAYLGDLSLPPDLLRRLVEGVLSADLTSLNTRIDGFVLFDITLGDGIVDIQIEPVSN